MKLYWINRGILFELLSKYTIQLNHAGECFCSGFMDDKTAENILKEYPDSLSLEE
jgi:hypothetical protein